MPTALGTALGTAIGTAPGAFGDSLFGPILALAAGRPVFTADYYAIDGVSGKVASFIDWNDPTHTLAQATSANQVVLPAASALINNRLCVNAVGLVEYVTTRSAAYWGGIQASGAFYDLTIPNALTTQAIWETTNDFTKAYMQRYYAGVTQNHTGGRPQASPVAVADLTSGAIAANTPVFTRVRSTSALMAARQTGASEVTAAWAAAPDGSAPVRGMALGRISLSSNFRLPFLICTPLLDAAGYATIDSYVLSTYGVAA